MKTQSWKRGLVILALSLVWLIAGCGKTRQVAPAPSEPETPSPLREMYIKALQDALNPEPHEISRDLTAIVPGNPDLVWKGDGGGMLLVVSWVGKDYYSPYVNKTYNTGKYTVWVTAANEVKEFVAKNHPDLKGEALELRLRQLLGLPPDDKKRFMVEFWVHPEDLFRPAPDNEIDDASAGLNLPADVTPAHRLWFNRLRADSYVMDACQTGYPWTQLGYTYDWAGVNDGSEVGPSEFVIRTNSDVIVKSVTPTEKYFKP
ncbi:MAG: hypothetical protein GY859_37550 [Desulfobacterales bacterium]|nr:hypothetical protein [Desulfobacterales bacterium]